MLTLSPVISAACVQTSQ